nr:MAG TPA: hypothetical protein [Caudoviricetes sp.]
MCCSERAEYLFPKKLCHTTNLALPLFISIQGRAFIRLQSGELQPPCILYHFNTLTKTNKPERMFCRIIKYKNLYFLAICSLQKFSYMLFSK